MNSYRGILLEPTCARICSKAWRPKYEQALHEMAAPAQWGGRAGASTESLHLQIRLWQSVAESQKLAIGIMFVDIRAAFYSVCKDTLAGFNGDVESLKGVFCKMKLPESVFAQFAKHVQEMDLIRKGTGSRFASDSMGAALGQTWYAIPNACTIMRPMTGSRPGDPIADILFGMLMSHVLHDINGRLERVDFVWVPGQEQHPCPTNVTWVDDSAFVVFSHAETIVAKTALTASIIMDTMLEYGMRLSYGVGKTAVMVAFHGPKAVTARQEFEQKHPEHIPVMSDLQTTVQIPVINVYKHLGGQIARSGAILPELQTRNAIVQTRLKPLRRILSHPGIDIRKRQQMLNSMIMSVATLHAGSWFNIGQGEYDTWQAMIGRIYQTLLFASTREGFSS